MSTVKPPLLICIQDSGLRRSLSFFKMQCGDDDDDDDDDGTDDQLNGSYRDGQYLIALVILADMNLSDVLLA